MKEDLAGGKLPSGDFGQNAAWWWIMLLTFNLNVSLKVLALDEKWQSKRMKAIRFHLISIPGRVLQHSRWLLLRLSGHHPSCETLIDTLKKIKQLIPVPAG